MYILGPISKEDDSFLQLGKLARNRGEEMKRRTKASNFGKAKPQQTTTEKEIENVINKKKNSRTNKKNEETSINNKDQEKDKQPKAKKYFATKEALNGIVKELIQMHKSADLSC
jgi:glucan-binding YG repeat protein